MSNKIRLCDKRAIIRARRIIDYDVKARAKEGLSAVANGLDWISNKMKERIDPEKYASEREARAAEKQKLKELSTIKGLLKECLKIIKSNFMSAVEDIKPKAIERLKSVIAKIKEKLSALGTWASQNANVIAGIVGILVALVSGVVFAKKGYQNLKSSAEQRRKENELYEVNVASMFANKAKEYARERELLFSKTKAQVFNILAKNGLSEERKDIDRRNMDGMQEMYNLLSRKWQNQVDVSPRGNKTKALERAMDVLRKAMLQSKRLELKQNSEELKSAADYKYKPIKKHEYTREDLKNPFKNKRL